MEPDNTYDSSSDEELGKGLALIHKQTNTNYGFYADNYCGASKQNNAWNTDWVDFYGKQRLGHILKLSNQVRNIPSEQRRTYEKLILKLPELIPDDARPSLIHGDLWSGNYMHTKIKPALIDPAAYYANREMEMGIMSLFGGFSNGFWAAYNEIFPLPNDWESRNKLYQLYHVLNHYYLFGGAYGQQAYQIAKYYVG